MHYCTVFFFLQISGKLSLLTFIFSDNPKKSQSERQWHDALNTNNGRFTHICKLFRFWADEMICDVFLTDWNEASKQKGG